MIRLRIVFACGLALFVPRAAAATLILGSFSGDITFVDPALTSQFAVGQTFSGEFSYDTDTPGFGGAYSILTFSATVSGYAAVGGNSFVAIENDSGGADFFDVFDLDPTGDAVNGYSLSTFRIDLSDASGTVFTSLALPESLDLTAFSSHAFGLQFSNPPLDPQAVGGTITSLTLSTDATVVPEPSTALLLVTALAALGRRRCAGVAIHDFRLKPKHR